MAQAPTSTKNGVSHPTKGELLATSYREMLAGFKQHYGLTGDLTVKAVIERAEHALSLNT